MPCFDTVIELGQLAGMDETPLPGGDSLKIWGGTIPGGDAHPAFSLTHRNPASLPVLLAVPHAGRTYPPELASKMRNPAAASLRLEDRLVDIVAEAVARETGATLLVAHAPRAMIDLNRSPDDMDWDMVVEGPPDSRTRLPPGRRVRSGLGLVPRRLAGMGEVWNTRISGSELAARIDRVHRPYHTALAEQLEQVRDIWGAALLIDLHSMPPLGPKRGAFAAPDFVIGDRFGASCDTALSASALGLLAAEGRRSAHNRPYAGGYVLDRHASPGRSIHAIQVEICRATYLDSYLREPGPGMAETVATLCRLVRRMAEDLISARGFALAAE